MELPTAVLAYKVWKNANIIHEKQQKQQSFSFILGGCGEYWFTVKKNKTVEMCH